MDVTSLSACRECGSGHDAYSGWGRLDITEAVRAAASGPLPRTDQFEPNDEAGPRAATLGRRKPVLRLRATLDSWDDRVDVYRVWLRRGQRISARLSGLIEIDANLRLFRPGTRVLQRRFGGFPTRAVRRTSGPDLVKRLRSYRAETPGWHYVEVRVAGQGSGRYRLQIRR